MTGRRWLLVGAVLALLLFGAARHPSDRESATPVLAETTTSDATVTPGAFSGTVTVDGRDRTFRLYVPSTLPESEAVPLVIGMHGGLGSGEQFARDARFDEQAERGRFIAVYPDGTGRGPLGLRTWNAGTCCGTAVEQQVDDIAFIGALLDHLAARLPVDAARVFVVGHSNGAMMALRLACEMPARIAAVASVAGSLEAPCDAREPVSVLSIHGDADESHPLEGGNGRRALTDVEYASVADTLARWRELNGCSGEGESTVDGRLTTVTWADCQDRSRVVSMVIAGGSHAWPGGRDTGPLRAEPSDALDASTAVWDFFAAE